MAGKAITNSKHALLWLWRKAGVVIAVILLIATFALGYRLGVGPATTETDTEHDPHAGHAGGTQGGIKEWICAMHPQIRKPTPGTCPICAMKLTPASAGAAGEGMRRLPISPAAMKLLDIQTTPVERRFVEAEVSMVGKIDYDETRLGYITAYVGGRLDRLFVDYTGVTVKKGDHMVELYSPELLAAQEELLQAIQAVKSLRQSDVGIVRETAQATVEASREKLRLWGLTKEQVDALEQRGKPLDNVVIYSPLSGIVIHKNAQEGMYVQTGTRIYTIADLNQLWVKFDAYESDLIWLRYGQQVRFTTEAYPGEVFRGQIAFIDPVLDDVRRTVKVRVNVPNEDGRLKPGMFARGRVKAQVASGGRVIDAALASKWISPMHPEIIKEKPGNCDKCGMPLVRAEELGYVSPGDQPAIEPLVVPASAVLTTGKRAIVYVKVPDSAEPTFEGREIVLGPRAGDHYIVYSNLSEGEQVVTKGSFKLDSELQLRAKPSMMTPDGGGAPGGGHDHGGHGNHQKPAGGDAGASKMVLPAAFIEQWRSVERAAAHIRSAAESQDIDTVQRRYGQLLMALDGVDVTKLDGHALALWTEMSMRLINDAVEGIRAANLAAVQQPFQLLVTDLARTREQLGLKPFDGRLDTGSPEPEIDDARLAQIMNSVPIARGLGTKSDVPAAVALYEAENLGPVTAAYFQLAQALTADDLKQAKEKLPVLQQALAQVKVKKAQDGQMPQAWIKASANLSVAIDVMAKAADIEKARQGFALLSEELAEVLRAGGGTASPVYRVKCPMAFSNRGATWLQNNKAVINPYFGDRMLRCGTVVETIAPMQAAPEKPEKKEHQHD